MTSDASLPAVPAFVTARTRTRAERLAALAALSETRAAEIAEARVPLRFRSAVVTAGRTEPVLTRAGTLTPYTLETIAGDVHGAGAGARLEVLVGPEATETRLAAVRRRLGWLAGRGVTVSVRRAA